MVLRWGREWSSDTDKGVPVTRVPFTSPNCAEVFLLLPLAELFPLFCPRSGSYPHFLKKGLRSEALLRHENRLCPVPVPRAATRWRHLSMDGLRAASAQSRSCAASSLNSVRAAFNLRMGLCVPGQAASLWLTGAQPTIALTVDFPSCSTNTAGPERTDLNSQQFKWFIAKTNQKPGGNRQNLGAS